ncbi:MAG TPA: NAD(P)H-binding protein, partial [Candidatus Acidoferrum sp.]
MPTILIIGATGTVGRQLISELLASNIQIRALLRNPDTAHLPGEVEEFRGDLTAPETLDPALKNVDAVFLVWTAPPATAPHQTPHPFFQQPNALSAVLSGIERHIESSSLQWTFIRPGMFAANCIHWWGPAFRNNEVVRWPLLQAPTAPIDPRDIAAVAASTLAGPT